MKRSLLKLYAYIFGGKNFYKINHFIFHLGLRGMGILNFENPYLTGEGGWLRKYLSGKTNQIVIDIGANKGDYSRQILKYCPSPRVFAFEPHPLTFKVLQQLQDDRLQVFNLGLGDKEESLFLYDYENLGGSEHASLYKDVIQDIHSSKAVPHPVKIITLDGFLKEHTIDSVDLLKIDTEGNEFKVLIGARESLSKNKIKAIHFEFNEMNIVSRTTFRDFWGLLTNYKFYRLMPGGDLWEITKYSPIDCEIYAFQNIIALLKN